MNTESPVGLSPAKPSLVADRPNASASPGAALVAPQREQAARELVLPSAGASPDPLRHTDRYRLVMPYRFLT